MPRAVTSPHRGLSAYLAPWRRGDGRHDGDGGSVSAPVVRLSIPLPDLMRRRRQRRKSPDYLTDIASRFCKLSAERPVFVNGLRQICKPKIRPSRPR